jgi:hypothetical protein
MHHVITDKEYMIWYICITRWIITLDPEQVPPLGYIQYRNMPNEFNVTYVIKPFYD